MHGLIGSTSFMTQYMSVAAWFVLADLLSPVGYVILDPITGGITIPADYSELGILLVTVTCLGLLLPMMTILFIQKSRFRSQ